MTQEEKARAYDEALKRADSLTEKYGGREFAEYVFPELAEREDERIRLALIKLMTPAGESYVMSATGFKKERLLAWLEKQKESLHVPEMCKENDDKLPRFYGD